MLLAQRLDRRLHLAQVVPRQRGEQVVLDLVVQAACMSPGAPAMSRQQSAVRAEESQTSQAWGLKVQNERGAVATSVKLDVCSSRMTIAWPRHLRTRPANSHVAALAEFRGHGVCGAGLQLHQALFSPSACSVHCLNPRLFVLPALARV